MAVEAFLGDGCNTSIRGVDPGMAGRQLWWAARERPGRRRWSLWWPSRCPGGGGGEGMRALEGCRLGMDLAMAAGSHGGGRGSAWPPAMESVVA